MLKGKIMKGIAGFYYVDVAGSGVFQCRAKGIFRKDNQKPLVGDVVEVEPVVDSDIENPGNLVRIFPRKNSLIRPAVANIDQAVVIFAAASPAPNLNLLDRFLIAMEMSDIPSVIVFNKTDLVSEETVRELKAVYENSGYPLLFTSAATGQGVEELSVLLSHKTSTVAGPSGAGKSTLINHISPDVQMKTGSISEKIGRGRHTTRHAQLIPLREDTYIVDTPGFTSFELEQIQKEELASYYPEMRQVSDLCRFRGCAHIEEPDCGVKDALKDGRINRVRYENYKQIYQELAARPRW